MFWGGRVNCGGRFVEVYVIQNRKGEEFSAIAQADEDPSLSNGLTGLRCAEDKGSGHGGEV